MDNGAFLQGIKQPERQAITHLDLVPRLNIMPLTTVILPFTFTYYSFQALCVEITI
jgi:hypothetical protein